MRVLVTGANGFLGTRVVSALGARGHQVRALVRPSKSPPGEWNSLNVEVVRGDLRRRRDLAPILENVDAIVHLAAAVTGDDETQFLNTVVATENLLHAAHVAGIDRFILCSSFSVYDWQRSPRLLDERSPLEADLYSRDGYAIAKTWQERLVRRHAASHNWRLTVLRPGFIWSPDADVPAAVGHSFGRVHVVFGGLRPLPLTHVENCADCFAAAVDSPAAVGETFNVVDPEMVTAWQFMGRYMRESKVPGFRIYVPHLFGIALAVTARKFFRILLGPTVKLPGLLVPVRFQARFRPLRFTAAKAQTLLKWRPRVTFAQAWGPPTIATPSATLATHSSIDVARPLVPELAVD
jgi:nucleoside-diphosphate-sugar epimerase